MTDIHAKRLRSLAKNGYNADKLLAAADRIEKLHARILLLEGYLSGALDVVEAFGHAETSNARTALAGEKKDD